MLKRLLIVSTLVLMPFATSADDSTQTGASSSLLGPQTDSSSGGSSADAAALQPAGITPLQSTTDDSSGLTSPNANSLQTPATSDQALTVLAGEADGAPHDLTTSASNLWLPFSLAILIALGLAVVWRDRRRFRVVNPTRH